MWAREERKTAKKGKMESHMGIHKEAESEGEGGESIDRAKTELREKEREEMERGGKKNLRRMVYKIGPIRLGS